LLPSVIGTLTSLTIRTPTCFQMIGPCHPAHAALSYSGEIFELLLSNSHAQLLAQQRDASAALLVRIKSIWLACGIIGP